MIFHVLLDPGKVPDPCRSGSGFTTLERAQKGGMAGEGKEKEKERKRKGKGEGKGKEKERKRRRREKERRGKGKGKEGTRKGDCENG